ncbi:MAG: ABC transporter ATP-binding protein [Bacteroidales bacterium]|jgi:lipoprotein-releasing system ATP-binding protein|nr:ABC transporter ATP-binding protein [Bacteroidales bacterium]NLK80338.1 ABC transporter ATP-binding protein [Bacteroidales bacterium]HKM31437.1 ABC transporter ATP-binding protein [Bacteroidales bacterium]HPX79240.1 ABC transporter ATP-binding protein [Bacteroidales bacterium]HQB22845.1 ABC transporter ATP-binding protein [Bacteroidales bacterium]
MIKADYITKSFGSVQVLKGVSLEVAPAEVLCITGASGAGKTTLLQILGTLLRPDMGQVWIGGTPVMELQKDQLADFRNKHIGFVFQFHHLLPEFTALENVCIPGLIAKDPIDKVRARAQELLDFLGMGHRIEHKPAELSGGEQQRVAVARALINQPKVLLADEPSGNLDTHNKEELHRLFFQLRDTYKQTIILVSHDPSLAAQSDRSLLMQDGLIV